MTGVIRFVDNRFVLLPQQAVMQLAVTPEEARVGWHYEPDADEIDGMRDRVLQAVADRRRATTLPRGWHRVTEPFERLLRVVDFTPVTIKLERAGVYANGHMVLFSPSDGFGYSCFSWLHPLTLLDRDPQF